MAEIIIQEGDLASAGDGSCLTPEDVYEFKIDCQTVELCCDSATIQQKLDRMTELVNVATGVNWCPEELCFEFSGTGTKKLFFTPTTSKYLNEIESIDIIKCGADCGQNLTEEVDLDDVKNHNYWLELTCDEYFPCGRNNIRVCGTWGKTMPQAIREAIIMLTIEALSPGMLALSNPGNISRASWEDFSISYRDIQGSDPAISTGYREIDQLLQPYVATASQIKLFVPTDDNCVPRKCGKVRGRC